MARGAGLTRGGRVDARAGLARGPGMARGLGLHGAEVGAGRRLAFSGGGGEGGGVGGMVMKTMRWVAVVAVCCAAAAEVPALQVAEIGDLQLKSGETIEHCRIAYRTIGTLNAAKSNAVLFPTWFTGSTAELVGLVGADGLVDPSQNYVILVDALGDGESSSPSNSKEQPRMKFPKFTIADMVEAEHRLVTEKLGITHLRAVMGISMGGMQTFQWVVSYPEFMTKAVPIVGSPRLTSYDLLLWQSEASALEDERDWNGGEYSSPPRMRAVAEIHNLALTTPAYRARETAPGAFGPYLEKLDADGLGRMDANDWLRQLEAMMSLDVSENYGRSMEKAAGVVKAKMLVVPSAQDHMVNPGPAMEFARMVKARVLELTSDCGHLAPDCEKDKLRPAVRAFLSR